MLSEKLNICVFTRITNAHGICGGMERHTDILSEGFAGLGHKVTIITTKHPLNTQYEERNGIRYYYLEKTSPGLYRGGWWRESIKKFEELNGQDQLDIVLSESTGARSYALNKNKFKLPLVTILHGTGFGELKSSSHQVKNFVDIPKFVRRFISITRDYFYDLIHLKRTDAIIAVSDELNIQIRKEFFLSSKQIFTVYNGIDTSLFYPDITKRNRVRQKFGIKEDEKLIVVSGNLEYQKGMHLAIKAFASILSKFNQTKLMIIGKGIYEKKLKEMVVELNLTDRIIFTGYISYNSVADYYNACDLFLMPTLRVEGFPMVLAEVMACGKPIIASRIGGTPSLIDDCINGILVTPGKVDILTENIIKLLNDKNFVDRLAENSQEKAIEEFSKEKMIIKTIGIIGKCLKESKSH